MDAFRLAKCGRINARRLFSPPSNRYLKPRPRPSHPPPPTRLPGAAAEVVEFPHLTPAVCGERAFVCRRKKGRLTGIIQNKTWERNKRTGVSCTASYNIKLEHQSRKSSYCRRLTRTGTGLERDIFAVPLQSRTEHIVSVFSLFCCWVF